MKKYLIGLLLCSIAFPPAIFGNKSNRDGKNSPKPSVKQESVQRNVVGARRGMPDRQNKKALILAPYKWEFQENDDASVPLLALSGLKDYEGRITYKANNNERDQSITIDDYLSFDQYDFIYLSSHGSRNCQVQNGTIEIISEGNSSLCRTVISTGIKFAAKDKERVRQSMNSRGIKGLLYSATEIYLSPAFFTDNYTNLTDKIIMLSACEQGQHNSLKLALENLVQNAQVYYFQNTVNASDAGRAYKHLLDRTATFGEVAPQAFDEMPTELKDNLPSSFYMKNDSNETFKIQTYTYLRQINNGKAMHLVEPVTFFDDKGIRKLVEGEVYPFSGMLDDGQKDFADFSMELLGYTLAELGSEGMTVTLKVDGQEVLTKFPIKADGEKTQLKQGRHEKAVIFTIKDVDLNKDLKKNSKVGFEVQFYFDNEHFGYHGLTVSTEISDLRIEMENESEKITMYYDSKIEAIKAVYPKQKQDMYGDIEGYYYINAKKDGWMKTKMDRIIGTIGKAIPLPADVLDLLPVKGTNFHKIAAFPGQVTIPMLNDHPAAKRISNENDPKAVYLVDGRLQITFDETKRLEKIQEGAAVIRFFYEKQQLTLPNAREITLPF